MTALLRRAPALADLLGGVVAAVMVAPLLINAGAVAMQPLGPGFAGIGAQAAFAAAILGALISAVIGGGPLRPFAPKIPYAAIVAALTAAVIAHPAVRPLSPMTQASLALAACGLAVAVAGAAQAALGLAGLGRVLKYAPYPLVAGLIDGFAVVIALSQAPALVGAADWDGVGALVAALWRGEVALGALASPVAAGLSAALGSAAAARFWPKAPAPLVGLALGTAAHHLLAWTALAPMGPLVGAPPTGLLVGAPFLWTPPWLWELGRLNALVDLAGPILGAAAALALVASIGALINAAAAEALYGQRIDGDRDLRDLGLIHGLCGAFGGLPGSGSPLTMRAMRRQGAAGRGAYLAFAACFAGLALALGPALALIPTAALAGVILAEVPGYFDPWTKEMVRGLRRAGRTAPASVRRNLAVAVGVALLTILRGPIDALAFGCAAALWAAMNQASEAPLRRVTSGAVARSKTARPGAALAQLGRDGDGFALIELQGSIFFGSADAIACGVEAAAAGRRRLILDLKRVTDVDGAGVVTLSRMDARLAKAGVTVTLAGLAPDGAIAQTLREGGWRAPFADRRVYETSDAALSAAEDAILLSGAVAATTGELPFEQLDLLRDLAPSAVMALRAACIRQVYAPGERIIVDGEEGDALHLLAAGLVSVVKRLEDGRSLRLAHLTPGVCFGEMGLLTGERRAADVVADEGAVCWTLTRAGAERLRRTAPDAAEGLMRATARILADRLRVANGWLRELEK